MSAAGVGSAAADEGPKFVAASALLSLSLGLDDPRDTLTAALSQLEALLCCTWGESGEEFRNRSDSLQDNYVWAASCILDTAIRAAEHVTPFEFSQALVNRATGGAQ